MAKYKPNPMAATPDQIREGNLVRWSRAPDQKKRNYGEMFHNSPGFDALHMIAQDVAGAEFQLYDKAKYKLDPEKAIPYRRHPVLDFIDDPCPGHKEIDGYMIKYLTSAYLHMVGEFFWVIERNAQGYPAKAYSILPTWVVQTWSVTFPFYRILPQGVTSARELVVDGQDIIWFKNPSAVDPFGRGRGRDEAIADELESDEYAAKYQKNLFFNDGQPPMIVTTPESDETVLANLKESWIQKISGWMNARKPMFTNTKVEVQKLTDSVREMDMVDSRKAFRDIFNQHYAMPPEMRGILENSNRSTIDSADYLYKKNVLSRSIKRFVDILNRQLVSQFDEKLILVCDNIVPEDEQANREWALKEFQAGLLTLNEYHAKIGQAKVPNGDYYLRPANVTMVLASEATLKPVAPVAPSPKSLTKGFTLEQKAAHWNNFDQKAMSGEDMFKTAVGKLSEKQATMFKAQFDANVSKGMDAIKAMDAAISFVFDKKMDVQTFNDFAPSWGKSVKAGGELAAKVMGASVNFNLLNPVFMTWVKDHGLEMAQNINGTTQEYLAALKHKIAASIEAGNSIDDQRKMMLAEFDKLSNSRAELIARTETMSSVNFGQFATYKHEGVKQKEWLATMDGRTRESHATADNQVVDIDEPFKVDGEELMYPGGGSIAANNCNCRCTILPVLEE